MLLLTTSAQPTMAQWAHPHHGRLLTPRHYNAAAASAAAGTPWACDNDGLPASTSTPSKRMVEQLAGLPGCRFVAVPDVVGDAWLTLGAYWEAYASLVWRWQLPPRLRPARRHPRRRRRALGLPAPPSSSSCARSAPTPCERRRWLHIGRVNSQTALRWAAGLGADSVDGTGWAVWRSVRDNAAHNQHQHSRNRPAGAQAVLT